MKLDNGDYYVLCEPYTMTNEEIVEKAKKDGLSNSEINRLMKAHRDDFAPLPETDTPTGK